MGFDPNRNAEPRRALRAGLLALARGSQIIEADDWAQAATCRDRPLAPDERERLKAVSVSDEVVRMVSGDRSKAQAARGSGLAARLARLRVCQSSSSQG